MELASLTLSEGPALTIAWSPNGEHLAIGNGELVQMWSADSLRRKNGVRHVADPSVTWRPTSETNGVVDGEHADKPVAQPSLSWSSDGESLAFAVDKQVSYILVPKQEKYRKANALNRLQSSASRPRLTESRKMWR